MSAGAVTDNYHHLQVRIPGWLLALALVVLGLWWGANHFSGTGSESQSPFPQRITTLDSAFENRVLTATVLLESNEQLQPSALSFTIILDDHSQLPASVREVGSGPWHGRSSILAMDRLIPEGRTPAYLQVSGRNGGAVVPLTSAAAQ
jgi:hypothetical protein